MNLQDLAIDLDQVTELEDTKIFHLYNSNVQAEERYEEMIVSFSFGVDLDQKAI